MLLKLKLFNQGNFPEPEKSDDPPEEAEGQPGDCVSCHEYYDVIGPLQVHYGGEKVSKVPQFVLDVLANVTLSFLCYKSDKSNI